MKPLSLAGILLLVVGALAIAYQSITYSHREQFFNVGSIHATRDVQTRIPLSPILGGLAFLGGIGLIVAGTKKKA
jgi:hypothetical protein